MVQSSTLVPRRDPFSFSLSLSLARNGLAIECIPSKFAQGGVWEGFQQGRRGQAGKGIGHIIFPQAGRSLVPPMRACAPHVLPKTQIPIHRVYCCLKHGQEKKNYSSQQGTAFLLGLFPACALLPRAP